MSLFKDFSKAATDLLNRDYPYDKPWDIEVRQSGDVPRFSGTAHLTRNNDVDAVACAKFDNIRDCIVEVKLGNSTSLLDVNFKPPALRGLVLNTRAERRIKEDKLYDTVELAAELTRASDPLKCRFSVLPLKRKFSSNAAVVLLKDKSQRLSLGSEVTYTLKPSSSGPIGKAALSEGGDLKDNRPTVSLGGTYERTTEKGPWTVGIKTAPYKDTLIGKLSVHGHIKGAGSRAPEFGLQAIHNVVKRSTSVSFGGLWWLDRHTSLKAKLASENGGSYSLAAALMHKLNDGLTVTVGAQIPVENAELASPRYGFKFAVNS